MKIDWRYEAQKHRERALMWIVWHLPREVVMWCAIRVFGEASTGKYARREGGTITAVEMIDAWRERTAPGGPQSADLERLAERG